MKIAASLFQGESADDIWRQAAAALTAENDYLPQDSRLGATRELLHCTFHLKNPRQRWVLSRQPAINPAFGIAEVVWILQGRDDSAFLNFWNPGLPKFAGVGRRYYGAYGHRLRSNLKFDQLQRAFEALEKNPDTRQVVMQIWDGRRDFPNSDGSARDMDVPCNICAMPKIRNQKLEWLQVMRSNDLYLGTPHNFIQFTTLQEIMSGWLGVEVGSYVQVSDSLHLYEHDMANFSILEEPPAVRNIDNLALPKAEFDEVLSIMGRAMDQLRSPRLTRQRLANLLDMVELPTGWQNLLCIVAADAARRRGWMDDATWAVNECTNPVLARAWVGWVMRLSN